jgi:hypothetical protein
LCSLVNATRSQPSAATNQKESLLVDRPSEPAAAFNHYLKNSVISRSVALSDIGVRSAIVLGGAQVQREIYWPVPANVPLHEARIELNAGYQRTDQGLTTLLLTLDNTPVMARGVRLDKGDANLTLAVPATAQTTGFVKLGIDWTTAMSASAEDSRCPNFMSRGNLLRIDPSSRITYQFDASEISDLSTAWAALSQEPVILVSGSQLGLDAFQAAWRIGLALERAGKNPKVMVLPMVGHEVDLTRIVVPEVLKKITSFAALSQGKRYVLKTTAEAGAWFVLSQQKELHADLIVADSAFVKTLSIHLDALQRQVELDAPQSVASFAKWREMRLETLIAPTSTAEVRLVQSPGGFSILVSPGADKPLSELFGGPWRDVDAGKTLTITVASKPEHDDEVVSLRALRGGVVDIGIPSSGDWFSSFDLDSTLLKGRMPGELVIDLAVAPSLRGASPVASVLFNDVLLASKRLSADGKPERLTATIPIYSLGMRNVVRVAVTRLSDNADCQSLQSALPASVLPGSHVVLGDETPLSAFPGVASRLSQGAEILIPLSYLVDAQHSLSRLIRVSAAAGLSPGTSKVLTFAQGKTPAPQAAFLAMDTGLAGSVPKSLVDKGSLVMKDEKDRKLLDIAGLSSIGVASVERLNGYTGIFYTSLADNQERYDKPFRFTTGNFAIVRRDGQLTQFDSRGNLDRIMLDEVLDSVFKRYFWWSLAGAVIIGFVGLLYAANRYRRRKNG